MDDEQTHDHADIHAFRDWMRTQYVRTERERDTDDIDDLMCGRHTLAGDTIQPIWSHVKCSRRSGGWNAFGAYDAGYGYCLGCDLILEREDDPEHEDNKWSKQYLWFPISRDRRSRDGWIRARRERAEEARHRENERQRREHEDFVRAMNDPSRKLTSEDDEDDLDEYADDEEIF